MRSRILSIILLIVLVFLIFGWKAPTVLSSSRAEENLRRYLENEPALLKIHIPADKNGVNYYPFRKDKKLDYAGRGVSVFKGQTATIYRVKVLDNYIEIQFNEGGGPTAGRIFSQSDWPFGGKNYGGRINVRFDRDISAQDLEIPHIVALLSPLFCLVKDYDKSCYVAPLPEKQPALEEAPPLKKAPTIQISANPPTIQRGECSALSWISSNADNVQITGLGNVGPEGSRQVCPDQDTCYEAVASGPGGSAIDSACVDLRSEPVADPGFEKSVRDVFFATDSSMLHRNALTILDANIAWLARNPEVRFLLEGHCDERATSEYNLGLGMRRVQAVRNYFLKNGITEDRFSVVSYGEERPFASCHQESCWSQNRRVHFVKQ